MPKSIDVDGAKIKKEDDGKLKKDGVDVNPNIVTFEDLIKTILDKKSNIQIITKDNPTCYWYWDGTQWRRYCW